jgi:hypothetical protein
MRVEVRLFVLKTEAKSSSQLSEGHRFPGLLNALAYCSFAQ